MMQQIITYTSHRISVSSVELPITIEAARAHLRAEEFAHDDEYIESLIRTAAATIEKNYGVSLLQQTIVETHSAFPRGTAEPFLLRISPLVSVSSIEYVDSGGATQTWSNTEYVSGRYNNTAFVTPKTGYSYPGSVAIRPDAIRITYVAGFGTKASQVPHDVKHAMLLMIGNLYDNREDAPFTLPTAADSLLRPYYNFSI